MIIGIHLGNGYGSQPDAWRMPWVDPMGYTSFDAKVRHAQAAERGKLQFLFLPDGPSHVNDIENEAPHFNLDVMLTLAALARGTERIGLVATGSTTFNEPYNLARQFKALDIMSHGRAGWNAVTSSGEDVAANYGKRIPSVRDVTAVRMRPSSLCRLCGAVGDLMPGCATRRQDSLRRESRLHR